MNQSVLFDANVHKSAKIRHVGDNARQFHANAEVCNFAYASIEFHLNKLASRVPSRFRKLFQKILQGQRADIVLVAIELIEPIGRCRQGSAVDL